MKKVALITDGWKRLLVYAWVDGIMKRSQETGEHICLYHYNSYGNWSRDERHNQGEYNIYNLPDLSQFDGIVVDCNNIAEKKQLKKLLEQLKKCNVPIVSINYEIEGAYYVGIDNKKPIADMMEHLYTEHGCRKFIFAGGPRDNYENKIRTKTYLQCLNKYDLDIADNPVLYGDYDFDTGIQYMQKIQKEEWELPDVFVCANDNIAAGICAEAERMDYHVPEDFRVTGFDNLDKAAFFQPQLTTVDHCREEIGGKSLDILRQVWSGKSPEKYHFITTECIFSESCGCQNSRVVDYRTYVKNQIINGVQNEKEDVMLVDLESDMSKCNSFREMFSRMGVFLSKYECDGFFVIVDKRLYQAETNTDFAVNGYDKESLEVAYACEKLHVLDISSLDELDKYLQSHGKQSEYLFTPIHFKEQTIGYSILKNGAFLYDNPHFYEIHSVLVKEMEALYRRLQLENSNRKLREIYNRDQLTGLYNRIAYNELLEPKFEEYQTQGIPCAIIFIDVNKFKQINDTYGHKYGDEVLKQVAGFIKKNCPENGYSFRYGGDEFVMFLPYTQEDEARQYRDKLKMAASELEAGISIGITVAQKGVKKSLKAYMEEADKDMYAEKMKHKN